MMDYEQFMNHVSEDDLAFESIDVSPGFDMGDMIIALETDHHTGEVTAKSTRSPHKLHTWLSKMNSNLNVFRNAKLDPQQNKDLMQVLNMAQPRTELNFSIISRFYKQLSLTRQLDRTIDGKAFGMRSGPDVAGRQTNLKNEIQKSIVDLKAALSSAQSSEQYKRLKSNSYKNEKMEFIPLSGISTDMKRTRENVSKYASLMDDFNKKIAGMKHIDETTKRMVVFLNYVNRYYSFRVSLLSMYFARAKASLRGTIRNVQTKGDQKYQTHDNTQLSKATWTTKLMKPSAAKELKENYEQALKAETYQKYKPYYDKVMNALGLHGQILRKLQVDTTLGKVKAYSVVTNVQKVNVGDKGLYHTAAAGVPHLTHLTPSYCGRDGYLFPEPRVYFHIGVPLNRCSNMIKEGSGETVYTPAGKITGTIWKDAELGGTAVYVTTTQDIPVKSIDAIAKQQKDSEDIDVDFKSLTAKESDTSAEDDEEPANEAISVSKAIDEVKSGRAVANGIVKMTKTNTGIRMQLISQKKDVQNRINNLHTQRDCDSLIANLNKRKAGIERKINGTEIRDKDTLQKLIQLYENNIRLIESKKRSLPA